MRRRYCMLLEIAQKKKFYLLWAPIRVWALIPTNYFRLGSYSSRGSNSSRGPKYSKYGISNLYRNLCTQLSNNSDTIRMNIWTVDLEYEKMRCFWMNTFHESHSFRNSYSCFCHLEFHSLHRNEGLGCGQYNLYYIHIICICLWNVFWTN